jgi:NAD dependent epimerase/dehydratase
MTPWHGKRVLVTGAGGFIGSHLVEALVTSGAEVRAFVHYNSRSDWANLEQIPRDILDQVDVVAGDIQDPFGVRRVVSGCETVFHLAALIGIPYSYVAPASYVATNVTGTLNVLEAARDAAVGRIIHTSTSETYGTARYTPIDEQHPLQGQSPYSASKIGADKLAESYYLSFELPLTILRPFNTYGPRQSLRAVIPTIVGQVLAGAEEVRLGSLSPRRDFTFVSDTVDAFMAVGTHDGTIGRTLNAGSGAAIHIGGLAQKVLEIIGSEATVVADPERVRPDASEVDELLCDASVLRQEAGWEPTVGLSEGLRITVDWFRERLATTKPHVYNI